MAYIDDKDRKEAEGLTDPWLSVRTVREHYGCSEMTIARWLARPELGFPVPIKLSGRRYWKKSWIEEFDREMVRRAIKEVA